MFKFYRSILAACAIAAGLAACHPETTVTQINNNGGHGVDTTVKHDTSTKVDTTHAPIVVVISPHGGTIQQTSVPDSMVMTLRYDSTAHVGDILTPTAHVVSDTVRGTLQFASSVPVTWMSLNPSVATVNAAGLITGITSVTNIAGIVATSITDRTKADTAYVLVSAPVDLMFRYRCLSGNAAYVTANTIQMIDGLHPKFVMIAPTPGTAPVSVSCESLETRTFSDGSQDRVRAAANIWVKALGH